MNEMSVEDGGMKFVAWINGRHSEKNLPRFRFVHRETHMESPKHELGTTVVGGGAANVNTQ